jgi:hypothetical protein
VENERQERLRRRIEEIVRTRVGSLNQDISRLQQEINESFNRLREQTDVAASIIDDDESVSQIAAEVNAQVDEASTQSVRLGADIALLRDSVSELEEQRTQAEVLNALIARVSNFAPRVVLFVVKSGNAVGWAARGLEDGPGAGQIRGMSIPLQSHTVLGAAVNSQQPFYGSPDLQSENQSLITRLGALHPQRVLAVPLKVRGKTAGLVYADSAERGESAINVEAIELLTNTAGLVVELVSLRARISEGVQAPRPAASTPAAVPAPTTSAGIQSGGLQQPLAQPSVDARPAGAPSPTFFRPTAEPAVGSTFAASGPASSGLHEEEEKAHNDARRFARLLVSEIKLYNEQKVAEGRRTGDLYDRLKEDVDRSRQMYDKRVIPSVAAKFDYFYDELVSTLAEGDPSKLGSDCPGPSVAVGN